MKEKEIVEILEEYEDNNSVNEIAVFPNDYNKIAAKVVKLSKNRFFWSFCVGCIGWITGVLITSGILTLLCYG